MPIFADVHNHSLFGLDDGAKSREDCEAMIAASYEEGVRHLCFTPHHHASYYKPDRALIEERFGEICAWAQERYPDLKLYLGNEVFGYSEGLLALQSGAACTLGGGRSALFEFGDSERLVYLLNRLREARSLGYIPVLAHAERYECLYKDISRVEELLRHGVQIQVNAASLVRRFGFRERRFIKRLLSKDLVMLIASDAHDMSSRKPALRDAYAYVRKKYGEKRADRLFYENPCRLLSADKEKEKV